MNTANTDEMENFNNMDERGENVWKELISHGRIKHSNVDERTLLVFGSLREKLKLNHKAKDESGIEIQLVKSELHLEELLRFGNELVNNIKSANEHHELLQSQDKHERETELQENLRKEAELSLSQFDEINKKWSEMNNMKEPMTIHEDMQRQRENIENLLASKNELIEQCQQELKKVNKKYYIDHDSQSEDICFLVERVDHQIKLLKSSYRQSVDDLQNTIEMEKRKILHDAQEKWNVVYEHLTENEAKKMDLVKDKRKLYAQELDNIRNKQEEITRTTKIRLEKDAEILELEIRKTQANILMNSEKIDYNYQVLQKRNDENIIINNQQKRRLAKLNESVVVLKKKLAEIRDNNNLAMEKLTQDIQKLHSSINDLHIKAEHFRKNNSTKLAKVWDINFKEIRYLVTRVFEIDRILYEQQLGREWIHPNFNFDKIDYIRGSQTFSRSNKYSAEQHKTIKPLAKPTCQRQLRDILYKISDRAGFLIEERLLQILRPYTDEEKCLVKIESIFAALNITNYAEVESLIRYFEPYSWCPNCSSGLKSNFLDSLYSFERNCNTVENVDDGVKDCQNKMNSSSNEIVCKNHIPCIEPTLVVSALNDFMSKETNVFGKTDEKRKCNAKLEVDLLQLDKTHVTNYWQQFSSCMSKEQQNVWKSIEHGLNHYLEVLKKRAQIDTECVFLQKQNAELKHLLQKL